MNGGGNLPVGPGIWGFIAFLVLAIALWLLVRNMNSRLRRMAYTDRERAEAAAAEAAARRGEPEGSTSGSTSEAADAREASETSEPESSASETSAPQAAPRDQPGEGGSATRP
ncbi:hypothetical protein [Humibacillus xanthopallidus]|uniref:Uncharacterized protein n=1 Tax=Humibacillus xanthopallidus TaxID=412689 RepID=A0A543I0J7_9MICO|nr:hypothetical protein [Humibacillus xanthopallidus]TQM64122.1 hypothetical protein FBY41_0482 [Humibacillus xanthopallidus]